MNYRYFIGIDIGKSTLDFSILEEGVFVLHRKIANTKVEIKAFLQELRKEHSISGRKCIYCIESGGPYMNFLASELVKKKANLCTESALRIKKTLGIARGKNDKIDSRRIAHYAYLHKDELRLWQAPRPVIEELKLLRNLRYRLQSALMLLRLPTTDNQFFNEKLCNRVDMQFQASLYAIKDDLLGVESNIQKLIGEDDQLSNLFRIITSVDGVGPVLAVEIIIATNEFRNFSSPKKFACYAGIAPFEYTSGTSLKGKAKISQLGSKRIKWLLHMAAMSAIAMKGELRDYYKRRVEEGRPKMSVLNIIRNKLVQRIFACVKEQREYTRVLQKNSAATTD